MSSIIFLAICGLVALYFFSSPFTSESGTNTKNGSGSRMQDRMGNKAIISGYTDDSGKIELGDDHENPLK